VDLVIDSLYGIREREQTSLAGEIRLESMSAENYHIAVQD
jgi:hypothetical protein